eukprot:CAMPEP_0174703426 /NCGR_PEP_ID=MMETSP1094-20130205/7381_1 /TAXON_ID=156173 /ORGANISM="Chrysochromulina brevifilum, Strain UTEX LB 985" /LENGTH=167 /DNA_ID=CAMNT_0015901349 /DNA_START=72 /DNA_END=572 /DNA_ORIENTATION=-
MPAVMKMHSPAFASPRPGEPGARPVVRQSKIYRANESGNAMKGIFGQDHLAWDVDQQQGVFQGQGVFDSAAEVPRAVIMQTPASQMATVEYPNPGSEGCCDACGEVVLRFYHCTDCPERTGLFDLCTECCAAIYLKKGTPGAMGRAPPAHPTHNYQSHRMIHVAAPG